MTAALDWTARSDPSRGPVILSVREPWASRLLDGSKRVELRRGRRDLERRVAALWRSRAGFVGAALLGGQFASDPGSVWAWAADTGMSHGEYLAWSEGAAVVTAVRVERVERHRVVSIDEMRLRFGAAWRPPRSWRRMTALERAYLHTWAVGPEEGA